MNKLSHFALPLLVVCGIASGSSQGQRDAGQAASATLEKMIVGHATVTLQLEHGWLEAGGSVETEAKAKRWLFETTADSFFTVLVLDNELRGPEPGRLELTPREATVLPPALRGSQLVLEKLDADAPFDLVLRDGKTGFVFFNIEGHRYAYDAARHVLGISGGRLLVSEELARKLGRPEAAGANAGNLTVTATVFPIEVSQVANGVAQSVVLPPSPERARLCRGPRCHRGRFALHVAIWARRESGRPGRGNDLLQQRDHRAELVFIARHRSPRHSAEFLSHEWRRE